MLLSAQWNRFWDEPEMQVAEIAIAGLVVVGIWYILKRISSGPVPPDPWDTEVAASLESDLAVPLCHRCLCPHTELENFCTECGAPVGEYTNYLPYPYVLSLGHSLRIGAAGEFKHSPMNVAYFMLLALAEYGLFAPIYWIRLILNAFSADLPSQSTPASETS
jgi:hypothetical protein